MRQVVLAAIALLAAAVASPAAAHRLSPAYFGLDEAADGEFRATFKVSISGGLVDALTPQIPDNCRISSPIRSFTVDDARVQIGRIACDGGLAGAEFSVAGLERTDTDVLVRVAWRDGTSFTHRLVPTAPAVEIPERAGGIGVAATYFVIGVEHILFGIDHLLFVLALLLLVDGFGRLVATITAFTVAHSITLGAATLGVVSVPSTPVEATIALSILFLATELARHDDGKPRADLAVRFPWLVAFAFGLLHGFGFAGALSEVGLPADAIPLALLFFNVGVEAGQLLFVGAFCMAAALVARLPILVPAGLRTVTVYVIGSVSAFWLIERTLPAF